MIYEQDSCSIIKEFDTAVGDLGNETLETKVFYRVAELANHEFLQQLLRATALPGDCRGKYLEPAYLQLSPDQRQDVLSLAGKLKEEFEILE